MEKPDVETIKQKIEECLELLTIEDGFIYLALRLAKLHTETYLENSDAE